jgi:hypothetical protein
MYYIPHGSSILSYFKKSRELDGKPLILFGLKHTFGCPPDGLAQLDADNSGIHTKPAPGFENIEPGKRLFQIQHRDLHSHLSGSALNIMTVKFVSLFRQRLDDTAIVPTSEWIELPDLYTFLRNEMFHASLKALCGDLFFEIHPGFNDDFWAWDREMLVYLRRLPRWTAPKAYALRDKCHAAVQEWHRQASQRFDWSNTAMVEAEWEPIFGSRVMRARQQMFKGFGGSPETNASMDLGMLWASVVPARKNIWHDFR